MVATSSTTVPPIATDGSPRHARTTTAGGSASETTKDAGRYTAQKTDAVWEQVKGNWHQFKGSVKSKWNDLTDDDIDQMKGERDR